MALHDAKARGLEVLAEFLQDGPDLGSMDEAMPAIRDFLASHAAANFICAMVPIPPTPAVEYPGVDGFVEAWDDWGGTFESVHVELEEIRDSERHIVLIVKQHAVTLHDRVRITQPSAMVWEFGEDGRVIRAEFHLDRDAALRAAGL